MRHQGFWILADYDGPMEVGVVPVMFAIVLAFVGTGRLLGGRVSRLSSGRLIGEPALFGLLLLHMILPALARLARVESEQLVVPWLLSASALLGLALMNSRWLGMWVLAIGLVMNLAVVSANHGMPVDADRAIESGVSEMAVRDAITESRLHVSAGSDTRLEALGDRLVLPGMTTMLSVGDLLLAVGVGLVLLEMMLVSEVDSALPDDV